MFETQSLTFFNPLHHTGEGYTNWYTVTAQYFYRRGLIWPWQIGSPSPIQVQFNNLTVAVVVDGAHPPHLRWDPTDPDGAQGRTKREVAFHLDDELPDTATGTFRVYRIPRPEGEAPVREETIAGFLAPWNPPNPPYTWRWDGRWNNPEGLLASAGVYAFDVGMVSQIQPPDDDWKRSIVIHPGTQPPDDLLTIYPPTVAGQPDLTAEYVGHDPGTQTWQFDVTYVLKDFWNAAAWIGGIEVYDLRTMSQVTWMALSLDQLTATSTGTQHTVQVDLPGHPDPPAEEATTYVFVVSAYDNHLDREKAHRFKPALENGQMWGGVVDLDWERVSGEQEETVGDFIGLNDDDDDGNGTADKDDPTPSAQEDDLVKMILQPPGVAAAGTDLVTFIAFDGAYNQVVRLWERVGPNWQAFPPGGWDVDRPDLHQKEEQIAVQDLPKELWVEGITVSTAARDLGFKLQYTWNVAVYSDTIRGTVIDLEFIDSEETATLDQLPLFNPNPIVALNPLANPGTAETVDVSITGTVKDYVAPIDAVLVNGTAVAVTQTSAGPGGFGPFEGTFDTTVHLDGNDTEIGALARNALNNVGLARLFIDVQRDANFAITGRNITAPLSVPPAPANEEQYLNNYRFKIRLTDTSVAGDSVNVEFNTGVETKTVTLLRGLFTSHFYSDNLFLLPENLALPANASDPVKATRLKGKFGTKPEVQRTIGNFVCDDIGIPTGILFKRGDPLAPMDKVESGIATDVTAASADITALVEVGAFGGVNNGAGTLTVDLQSLDAGWANLGGPQPPASFPPVNAAITLTRLNADPQNPEYHLFRSDAAHPVMAVRTELPAGGNNPNLTTLFVRYDGSVRASTAATVPGDANNVEPVVGLEIVAFTDEATNAVAPAGLIPTGSPAPPVASVADWAPRPQVTINSATYNNDATPPTVHVVGTVTDYVADNTSSAAADITQVTINGTAVALTVAPRNTNVSPPQPFRATFDTNVSLTVIPQPIDVAANQARLGQPPPFPLLIAQEAIIVRAENALGNTGFDSVFVQIRDPDGDGVNTAPPGGPGAFAATIAPPNDGTLYDIPPNRYYVEYSDPLRDGNAVNSTLTSRDAGGAQVGTLNATLERNLRGHLFRSELFVTGRGPTAPAAGVPCLPIAGGGTIEATAPAPSRNDTMETLGLELQVEDPANPGTNIRMTFLPTGTDVVPTPLNLVAVFTPTAAAPNRTVTWELRNVTRFTGHCANAPRPIAGTDDDFSFDPTPATDDRGPTPATTFDAAGRVTRALYSKDWGGRTVVQATLDLPGNPRVLMELPVDTDGDFLPEEWANRANVGNLRDGLVDDENASGNHNERGDGFTALEEYRGFQWTDAAGTHIDRMDQIPNAFGLIALGGGFGGPQQKDVFVFRDTVLPRIVPPNPTFAQLFNVAFHEVSRPDFSDNLPDPAPPLRHNHDMNFNGDNDGFNAAVPNGGGDRQAALHIRDQSPTPNNLWGECQSFRPDDLDIVFDNNILTNPINFYGLPVAPVADMVIFHETGHKVSLRHNLGQQSAGQPAFPNNAVPLQIADGFDLNNPVDGNPDANGLDFLGGGPIGNAPDGNPDGAVRIDISAYQANDGLWYVRGNPLGEIIDQVNQTGYLAPNRVIWSYRSLWNMPQLRFIWAASFVNQPNPGGAVRGYIFSPETMDWTLYGVAGGPAPQRLLNSDQMDRQGNPLGGVGPDHSLEVRVRTNP